jgi:hypothetical protein
VEIQEETKMENTTMTYAEITGTTTPLGLFPIFVISLLFVTVMTVDFVWAFIKYKLDQKKTDTNYNNN